MQAQEAIDARRAAEAARRGGANETDTRLELAHPAHQVLLGTLIMKKEKKQHVGQLWRP